MKKIKIASWVAVVLTSSLFLQGCSDEPVREKVVKKVKAIQLGAYSGIEQRAFPGKAQAVDEANLSFRVSGQMATLSVKSGDSVESGDMLAELDDTDFRNSVQIAEGLLAEAEAAYINADRNYKRALDIQKTDPGIISQVMIDQAQADASITQAAKTSAEASLKLAQDRLAYASLKAPFSGEVVATYVEAFETIIAKQNIIRLINRNTMEFVFDVPESLIGYANAVAEATVVFDVKPDVSIVAKVKEIGREASASTRTYPVTLLVESSDKFDVLPGMAGKAFIKATLPEDSEYAGINVPATALFSEGEMTNSFVWVINNDTVQKRAVEVVRPTDYGIKIGSGLQQGDWIVVAGVHSLIEGQQVRVMDATTGK